MEYVMIYLSSVEYEAYRSGEICIGRTKEQFLKLNLLQLQGLNHVIKVTKDQVFPMKHISNCVHIVQKPKTGSKDSNASVVIHIAV
jgi:hypothetical protein